MNGIFDGERTHSRLLAAVVVLAPESSSTGPRFGVARSFRDFQNLGVAPGLVAQIFPERRIRDSRCARIKSLQLPRCFSQELQANGKRARIRRHP